MCYHYGVCVIRTIECVLSLLSVCYQEHQMCVIMGGCVVFVICFEEVTSKYCS